MPFEDKEGCPNIWRFHFWQNPFLGCPKIKASKDCVFGIFLLLYSLERKVVFMRKKNYKGAKVSKRVVAKCEGVYRTYERLLLLVKTGKIGKVVSIDATCTQIHSCILLCPKPSDVESTS